MSNRPLVYVLFPGRPLSPSAREAMDKGVFLFDSEADNFWDELRDFLSQPIEKIEAKWLDRAAARADLIHEFFDAGNGHAAARAADMLEQSNFNPSRMA